MLRYAEKQQQYSRRDFLKIGTATSGLAALATTAGCGSALRTGGDIVGGATKTLGDTVTAVYKTAEGGVFLVGKATEGIIKGSGKLLEGTGRLLDGTGKFLQEWVDNGFNNYESLDVFVYGDIGDQKRIDAILYGVGHFLPHYVADLGRGFHSTFVAIPNETMEKAKNQKAEQYGPDGPKFTEGKGPLEDIARAAEGLYILTEDTARVLANYVCISGDGVLTQIKSRPLDTAGKMGLTIQLIDLASNGPLDWAEHGNGGGGGEQIDPGAPGRW